MFTTHSPYVSVLACLLHTASMQTVPDFRLHGAGSAQLTLVDPCPQMLHVLSYFLDVGHAYCCAYCCAYSSAYR